jgi:predicted RNA-binding protein with PUA-like domain
VKHWLVKSEPDAYSFAQFSRDKTTAWTGVRNYQARIFLREMAKGDEVFFYHSMTEKAVVGLGSVIKTAYPDPTVEAGDKIEWVCVDLKAGPAFTRPVSLDEIKKTAVLKNMRLLRQSRLSVSPVTAPEAAALRRLGGL